MRLEYEYHDTTAWDGVITGQGQCHICYWQLSGFDLELFQRGVWLDGLYLSAT